MLTGIGRHLTKIKYGNDIGKLDLLTMMISINSDSVSES